MLILALDSTAQTATVSVCDDEKLLSCHVLQNGNTHSETLLPMVQSALRSLSLTVNDIGLFACSAGPGSFTGVRIGVSTVKGLAFGKNVPCIGVSTLEALAYNLIGSDGLVCPLMDARRAQVYTALFSVCGGHLERKIPDSALSLSELDGLLCKRLADDRRPLRFVGDGYALAERGLPGAFATGLTCPTPELLRMQNAYSVAQIALARYRAGDRTSDSALTPVYLRPCQAERERADRLASEGMH